MIIGTQIGMREAWDRIGITASILCMLHCLLTPILVMMIPLLGTFLDPHIFHAVIAVVIIPVAMWALWNGYRLHRLNRVVVLGALGITFVILGMIFGHDDPLAEIILMVIAGLSLASAHFVNLRACRAHH